MNKNRTEAEQNTLNQQLFNAVIDNDLRTLKAALAEGADINTIDARGNTPLHFAAILGNTLIATYLIAHGAKHTANNNSSLTPLLLATTGGNNATTTELLQAAMTHDPIGKLSINAEIMRGALNKLTPAAKGAGRG